jgi:signal transduction histidine kinase/ActR/RegA family two-component response regulator
MLNKKAYPDSHKLFSIVEGLKDGFCTLSIDGEIIYANLAAIELLRLKENKVQNFYKDIIRDSNHIKIIKQNIDQRDFLKDYEVDLFMQGDDMISVLLTFNLIKNPSKNIIGLAVLIKDMTYIKQVQHQLLQAQKMESIGMLASGVAHEFNNILTGIIPNAELIKMTTDTEGVNYKRADSIQKSANRATDIVKKLLNFAREDKSTSESSTDFVKCANDTIDILTKLLDRNIHIESDFEDNLFDIAIDETSIQQIIMNLAINAKDAIINSGKIKFSAKNYVVDKNNYSSSRVKSGKYVKFTISDTGHGIEKSKIKYIFDPFYTTKKPGQGTGLGLSMVYGIITSIKGYIDVESYPDRGTTFTILLPATERRINKYIIEKFNKTVGEGQTVLVVDDEEMIIEIATDMLSSIGFKVIGVTSGIKAIETYETKGNEIDAVILDLLMPEMNGVTCFKKLKEMNPSIKVIIASGIGEIEKKKELEKMGIFAYIEKPFNINSISQKLNALLKEEKRLIKNKVRFSS